MEKLSYKINLLGVREIATTAVTLDSYTDLLANFPDIESTIEQSEVDKAIDAIENNESCYFRLFVANIGVTKEIVFYITVTSWENTNDELIGSVKYMITIYLRSIDNHLRDKMFDSVIDEAVNRILGL